MQRSNQRFAYKIKLISVNVLHTFLPRGPKLARVLAKKQYVLHRDFVSTLVPLPDGSAEKEAKFYQTHRVLLRHRFQSAGPGME